MAATLYNFQDLGGYASGFTVGGRVSIPIPGGGTIDIQGGDASGPVSAPGAGIPGLGYPQISLPGYYPGVTAPATTAKGLFSGTQGLILIAILVVVAVKVL